MLKQVLFLVLAGGAGTICRAGIGSLVQRAVGSAYPLGTLVVNILGCFIAGACLILAEQRFHLTPEAKMLIFVGFFGAFTTFSALIVDAGRFIDQAQWAKAASVLILHNSIGIVALLGGIATGKKII